MNIYTQCCFADRALVFPNNAYFKSVCLYEKPLVAVDASSVCNVLGMKLYDMGDSAYSKTAVLSYVAQQNMFLKFWVQDSSSQVVCPRLENNGSTWIENANPMCSDNNAVLCEYIDILRKFLMKV